MRRLGGKRFFVTWVVVCAAGCGRPPVGLSDGPRSVDAGTVESNLADAAPDRRAADLRPDAWPRPYVTTLAGTIHGHLDGPVATARFGSIQDLAVDAAGRVYVAETNCVRLIEGGVVSTLAGECDPLGTPVFKDGPAAAARFRGISSIAVGTGGPIYVTDWAAGRVRQIHGGNVTTIAGNGSATYQDGPALESGFSGLDGLAVSSVDNVYVSSFDGVQLIHQGMIGTLLAGGEWKQGSLAQASAPPVGALDLGPNNEIYLKSQMPPRIGLVAAGQLSILTGEGASGYVDGPAFSASFEQIIDIAANATTLYITDNCRVRMLEQGMVSTLAGTGDPGSQDGPAHVAEFAGVTGIDVDSLGRVYVGDIGNARIRMITR